MPFNDDEEPPPPKPGQAKPMGITGLLTSQVQLSKYHSPNAPMEPNDQEVLLELKGISSAASRAPLDLVAVIDVSSSMEGEKLENAKKALCFIICKLTDHDRLSIVQFDHEATRLCPLRCATEGAKADLEALVGALRHRGATNIEAGLETGLRVVNERKFTAGRAANIMLMSDGEHNIGYWDPNTFLGAQNVPVHTFGFGSDHDSRMLGAIAKNSLGGVYNFVDDSDKPANLAETFSQVLAGLVAQDLELTVTPVQGETAIKKVDTGSYQLSASGDGSSSVTVKFGTLYSTEENRVIVDLALSDRTASDPYHADVAVVQDRFTVQGQQVTPKPQRIKTKETYEKQGTVTPKPNMIKTEETNKKQGRRYALSSLASHDPQRSADRGDAAEEVRRYVDSIRAAMAMADGGKLNEARNKLVEELKALDRIVHPMADVLRKELLKLLELFKTKETYKKQGRPYAISSLASHDRQRFASRGDAEDVRLCAARRKDTYLEQAKKTDDEPDEKPPSADDDVQEEPKLDPEVQLDEKPEEKLPSADDDVQEEPEPEVRSSLDSVRVFHPGQKPTKMAFDDDEEPPPPRPAPARVQLTMYQNANAPLAANDQEVLLEIKGTSSAASRAPLDLVAVIDVSGSMKGDKLENAKRALCFIVRKLTDQDRLSIVQFNSEATRLCPLRSATEAARADLEALVGGLEASGGTNIQDGLEKGLGVVGGRRFAAGRAANIMLMSDGVQTDGDARAVEPGDVPVHTFGFGSDHDSALLGAVAAKSLGGVYNYVDDDGGKPGNLSETFSQLLAGLVTIVAQDLELTVTPFPGEAAITKVDAYHQPTASGDGGASSSAVTVKLGNLYSAEERRVIVVLTLSDRTGVRPYRADLAVVQYRFAVHGQQVASNPERITMRRGGREADVPPPSEVQVEVVRRRHAESIGAAVAMADGGELGKARSRLVEALNALDTYLEQAKQLDEKPDEKLPSADDDVHEEPEPEPEPEVEPAASVGEGRRTLSVALRVLTAVLGWLAFSIMASPRTFGFDGDGYGRYEPRYAVGVNVIICFYSMAQAFVEIRRLVSPRLRSTSCYCVTLFLDQVLAYLLMSASSAAASGNRLWASRFGKDRFNDKINVAVWFSFLGFLALSGNTLISTVNLFRRI